MYIFLQAKTDLTAKTPYAIVCNFAPLKKSGRQPENAGPDDEHTLCGAKQFVF